MAKAARSNSKPRSSTKQQLPKKVTNRKSHPAARRLQTVPTQHQGSTDMAQAQRVFQSNDFGSMRSNVVQLQASNDPIFALIQDWQEAERKYRQFARNLDTLEGDLLSKWWADGKIGCSPTAR